MRVAQKEISFVSRQEALVEIANLAARLATRAGEAPQTELEWLAAILKALDEKKWLEKNSKNGKIWTALAGVYSEAQQFSVAIEHFRTAIGLDPSAITLKDIEQLANLLGRQALASYQEAPRDPGNQSGQRPENPIVGCRCGYRRSHRPLEMAHRRPKLAENNIEEKKVAAQEAPGKTVERLSLLGSAYKRKAWISNNPGPALEQMKQAYEKAWHLAEKDRRQPSIPNSTSCLPKSFWVGIAKENVIEPNRRFAKIWSV